MEGVLDDVIFPPWCVKQADTSIANPQRARFVRTRAVPFALNLCSGWAPAGTWSILPRMDEREAEDEARKVAGIQPTPPLFSRRWGAIILIYAGALLLQARCAHQAARHPDPTEEDALAPVPAGPIEELALTGTSDGGVPRSALMPKAPLPWQQTPPCEPGEHAINGACYMRWDREDMTPPCSPGSVEWEGRCYRPIRKPRVSGR